MINCKECGFKLHRLETGWRCFGCYPEPKKDTPVQAEAPEKYPVIAVSDKLEAVVKNHILNVYKNSRTKAEAASRLGITVKTLYNRLEMYGEHFKEERSNV